MPAGLARRFAEAFVADDVDGVIALLTDDAWLAIPPATQEYRRQAAVGGFLRASAEWRAGRQLRLVPTRASAQPAFGCYLPTASAGRPTGVLVLTIGEERIAGITRFLDSRLHRHFGLPEALS